MRIANQINYSMLDPRHNNYPIETGIAEIIHEGFRRIIAEEDRAEYLAAANELLVAEHGTNIIIHGDLGAVIIEDIFLIEFCGKNGAQDLQKILNDAENDQVFTLIGGYIVGIDRVQLMRIACNADHPRAEKIRRCLCTKKHTNIRWEIHNNAIKH